MIGLVAVFHLPCSRDAMAARTMAMDEATQIRTSGSAISMSMD